MLKLKTHFNEIVCYVFKVILLGCFYFPHEIDIFAIHSTCLFMYCFPLNVHNSWDTKSRQWKKIKQKALDRNCHDCEREFRDWIAQ